jgi:hypothetical protein
MLLLSRFAARAADYARMAIWVGLLALLSVGAVAACQAPAGAGSSSPPAAPDQSSAPVAPAIETEHPDAESPIPLPSSPAPVAPAIELEHSDHDLPLEWPSSESP